MSTASAPSRSRALRRVGAACDPLCGDRHGARRGVVSRPLRWSEGATPGLWQIPCRVRLLVLTLGYSRKYVRLLVWLPKRAGLGGRTAARVSTRWHHGRRRRQSKGVLTPETLRSGAQSFDACDDPNQQCRAILARAQVGSFNGRSAAIRSRPSGTSTHRPAEQRESTPSMRHDPHGQPRRRNLRLLSKESSLWQSVSCESNDSGD